LKDRVVASEVLTPDDLVLRYGPNGGAGVSPLTRLLSTYETRVRTALPGLFLCGSNAEPAGVISGRAARIAATLASAELQEAKRSAR
jgi:phytoene dehydrogenase-like protein